MNRCLYPGLPCLANLRCGLWYQRAFDGTCYFKSTDGHSGNWAFSATRLNLHVARAAATAGGALIVDATRRGKAFPDALAKTVPCWAAVLNRAVAQLRRGSDHCQERGGAFGSGEEAACGGNGHAAACDSNGEAAGNEGKEGRAAWDSRLHVPPWISASERSCIEQRMSGWVHTLLEVRGLCGGVAHRWIGWWL